MCLRAVQANLLGESPCLRVRDFPILPVPLRILLAPCGSEGDVNPLLWLAEGLAGRGHDVTVLLTPHYGRLADRRGLRWVPVGTAEEFLAFARDPRLWQPRTGSRLVIEGVMKTWDGYAEAWRRTGGKFDLVICSSVALAAGTLAEAGGVPRLTLHMQPICLRSVHECPLFLEGMEWICAAPPFLKRALFWLIDRSLWETLLRPLNIRRQELGLPPLRGSSGDVLNGGEGIAALFPEWFAAPQPDWPPNLRQFGFPLSRNASRAQLPPDLADFLRGGSPVLWTHGSANFDLRHFQKMAVECSAALGLRSVLVSLDKPSLSLPENIFHAAHVPFEPLLPHCRAIVHHGGIGTTSKAIAAGLPQLIVPRAHDQPDNARRVERLGLGRPLSYRKLSSAALGETLRFLLDSTKIRTACQKYHDKVLGEDPLPSLCDWAEQLAAKQAPYSYS